MKKLMMVLALAMLGGLVNLRAADAAQTGECDATQPNNMTEAGKAILLYIPNRLLDLADCFTLSVGGGSAAAFDASVTQYTQLGGSYGGSYNLLWGFNRHYGVALNEDKKFGFLCFDYDDSYVSGCDGTINEYAFCQNEFTLANPDLEPYRDGDADFWSISARAGLFAIVEVGFHPTDLYDFFCGIVLYDPAGDDLK